LAVDGVEDQLFRAVIELALIDDGYPGVFAGGNGGGTGTRETESVIVINAGGRSVSHLTGPLLRMLDPSDLALGGICINITVKQDACQSDTGALRA
jgi:hypothetical protein